MNGYRCIACNATQTVEYAGFLCPDCGGNLDITYDYENARRAISTRFEGPDDIFRYAPLLPVEPLVAPFPLKVGRTPIVWAERLGQSLGLDRLYLKDDTGNPSASTKDRASAIALQRAVDTGAGTVAVASTGNAGSSTACIAAALGLKAIVLVPEDAPVAKLTQTLAYGATLLAVRGTYDDAYDLCLQAADEFGWFNRSTGFNPFTREGKKTCSYEILEGLQRVPDRVVVPTGDGNILSGIWKGWCDLKALGLIEKLPKIDCARADPDTIADSISVIQPRDGLAASKAVAESGGVTMTVTDDDILTAIPEIARTTGIFAEPAAAASWAAVKRLVLDKIVDPQETIVCLITGNGLKDVPTAASTVGKPTVIEPTLEAVSEALE
jgi:threonine synthase